VYWKSEVITFVVEFCSYSPKPPLFNGSMALQQAEDLLPEMTPESWKYDLKEKGKYTPSSH